MDDYDEDLGENSWYLAFTHKQSLFAQVTNERWTVCVPKTSSWKGGDESATNLTCSTFESHCIKFEGEIVPPKKEDTDHDGSLKRVNKYVTFNGKTLLVEGSKIVCGAGFAEKATSFDSRSGQLELPSGFSHHSRILFEETYFNSHDQSYKVLCISRPLELPLVEVADGEWSSEERRSPQSGDYRFSSKLQGYHLWCLANNAEKLKNNIDAKIISYIRSQGQAKDAAGPRHSAVEEGCEAVEMSEMDNIQACVVSAQSIFNTCLQIALKDSKIKKKTELPSAMDAVKYAVERYVLQEIYGCLFRQLSSFVAQQEATFNKMARNLSDIQLKELGVDERYWVSLPKAKRQLLKINKCCTPQDKLACLQQTVFCITAKQEEEVSALGSDDLLPIFVYLVIKSNIPNWITNLVYLRHFQLMPILGDQYRYYLTTLEAAIEHIKQGGVQSVKSPIKENVSALTDTSPMEKFFQSIEDGDVSMIKKILDQSAKEHELREQKMCHPLCACDKCSELKRRVINKSPEFQLVTVQTRNDKGQTALHVAASTGQHEVVDLLKERGAELNAVDYHGSTPLHTAAETGSQSVVFLLLHHGANANTVDNNNNTPLHLCCQRGHEACVKAFLYFDPTASVVAVDAANDDGDTPLHIASRWGYEGVVSALIECGANINALNRRRQSAVDVSHNSRVSNTIKVAASQVVKLVRTLKHLQPLKETPHEQTVKRVEKKRRQRTNTPKELEDALDNVYVAKQVEKLFRAVSDNDINMVKFLCGWLTKEEENAESANTPTCHPLCQCTKCQPLSHEHVLHANSSNQERYTGLMIAAKHGYADMARLFLDKGASVNAKTKRHGYSPLHFAAEKGHAEVAVVILSQNGANADIRDLTGSTPLYMCAIHNFPDCALALLERGASLNIRDRKGSTPLHAAVKWKNVEVIKIFLEHGALVYYKDNDGMTPIDFAEKDSDIWSLLVSQSQYEDGLLPLPVASISPHSVATPGSSDDVHPSSGGFVAEPTTHESASALDEALADDLYDKFKDPAPPTPPPVDGSSAAGPPNLDCAPENMASAPTQDSLQRRLFDERRSIETRSASGRESDDALSDIFRELASVSAPTTLGVVDENSRSLSSKESNDMLLLEKCRSENSEVTGHTGDRKDVLGNPMSGQSVPLLSVDDLAREGDGSGSVLSEEVVAEKPMDTTAGCPTASKDDLYFEIG